MKKTNFDVSNQEDLNKHLQHTSIVTWASLGFVILLLIGFFIWSSVYKLKIKITGSATISNTEVTLHVSNVDLDKLSIGQLVYIEDKEGSIVSFNNGQPVVTNFDLANGDYTYTIIREMAPINFLIGK